LRVYMSSVRTEITSNVSLLKGRKGNFRQHFLSAFDKIRCSRCPQNSMTKFNEN